MRESLGASTTRLVFRWVGPGTTGDQRRLGVAEPCHRAWAVGMRLVRCSLGSLGRLLAGLLEAVLKLLGGRFEASFGPLLGLLGASWGLFWASWGPLGASWGPLGGLLGPLGSLLGPSWGPLGASWAPLGAILEDIDQRRGVVNYESQARARFLNGKSAALE